MRSGRRGFLLVFALLLTTLISLIALSLLGMARSQYSSSRAALERAQCRSLARAGMEDAEIKLAKDPFFPSGVGDNQVLFSYSEEVRSVRGGERVGSFLVTVDRSEERSHQLIRIESTAVLGQDTPTSARFTVYGELSVDPDDYGFKVWREGVLPSL